MPTKAIVSASADEPRRGFDSRHPLADVVTRLHRAHGGVPLFGRTGCAACWERAIRDDERIAVEYELPRDLTPDPTYIDEIAVELACRGERPELTAAERSVAIARLLDEGMTRFQVARTLGVAHREVPSGWVRRRRPASGRSLRLLTCTAPAVTR
jgi:transposase-like protein